VTGAPDLSPTDARDRWLDKLTVSRSDSTVSTYYYRLKLFTDWADSEGIESINDMTGWQIESYETYRRSQGIKLITLNNELTTLKRWFEYLARIEVIDKDLPEKVEIPDVPREEQSDDTHLHEDRAKELLSYYRDSPDYATREHVLLELAWHTGARAGGLRALDLRDMREADDGTRYLSFENREETGTRLKKGIDGERPVTLNSTVWDVIDEYVRKHRIDVHDDEGRQPLITSSRGRPARSSIRDWLYMATLPCHYKECPHDKNPQDCEFTNYQSAGGCPSSRSPHQVITGAITSMRNQGIPAEVVADRVNKQVSTIEKYYDKETDVQEMLKRRDPYFSDFDVTNTENDDS